MTDIVTRLREGLSDDSPHRWTVTHVHREAADEIEGLRALLAHAQSEARLSDTAGRAAMATVMSLRALLAECANEMEDDLNAAYPHRDQYRDQMRRWERDMDIVRRVRAAISPTPAEETPHG